MRKKHACCVIESYPSPDEDSDDDGDENEDKNEDDADDDGGDAPRMKVTDRSGSVWRDGRGGRVWIKEHRIRQISGTND